MFSVKWPLCPQGCILVHYCCKCNFQGVGGHVGFNPEVMKLLNELHFLYKSFRLMVLDLNIFSKVATVTTGLHTCALLLQMHLSGGGGTPCLHPKSDVTFKITSINVSKFMAAHFGFKYFHYSGHFAHKVANFCKSTANAPVRGWGDTLLATQK